LNAIKPHTNDSYAEPAKLLPRLGGIFAMQSLMTMAIYSLPVIVPIAAPDLGIAPESVGFFVACIYGISMFSGLFSGDLVDRLGATRVFRLMLGLTALAVSMLLFSAPWAILSMVLILGLASGPMNPTGSHVLSKIVPVDRRALVFSIKQCATPAGGVLAGALLPPLMLAFGWQKTVLLFPLLAVLAIVAAGWIGLGRRDPQRVVAPVSAAKTWRGIVSVVRDPIVAKLTVMAFCLAMAQMALTTYLVVYVWREAGFSEQQAGLLFAALHISGISSRLLLGSIADRLLSAGSILIVICLTLGVALLAMAFFSPGWHLFWIGLVVVVAGGTGNGWVGLYFSELARLAPADQVAQLTGASQFYTYLGLLLGPLLFGVLLAWSASYRFAFIVFAVAVMATGLTLLMQRK